MVLEIPSGAIADMLGRNLTIAIGTFLNFVHVGIDVFIDGPVLVWTANIVWVVSFALISGADSSLVVDSLKVVGEESRFRHIQGKANSYRWYLAAFCAIGASYLAEINMRIPFVISAILMLIPFAVALFFIEPPHKEEKKYTLLRHKQVMLKGIKVSFCDERLLWAMLFTVVVTVVSKIWFFSYNPYFKVVNLPLAYYGYVFFLLNIIAAVTSQKVELLHRILGDFKSVVLMVLLLGVPILAMGMFSYQWCVLLAVLQNIVRGYLPPFIEHYQHGLYESETRATCASVSSAVHGLGEVLMLGAYALLLDQVTVQQALIVLGVFTLLVGSLLIWRFRAISS